MNHSSSDGLSSHVSSPAPYSFVPSGVKLHILLNPRSSKDQVGAVEAFGENQVLRIKVRALPEKGLANKALIKLVAKWLQVARSDIELVSGFQSRHKVLLISGCGDVLANSINQLIS